MIVRTRMLLRITTLSTVLCVPGIAGAFNVSAWNSFQERCDEAGSSEVTLVPPGFRGGQVLVTTPDFQLDYYARNNGWSEVIYKGSVKECRGPKSVKCPYSEYVKNAVSKKVADGFSTKLQVGTTIQTPGPALDVLLVSYFERQWGKEKVVLSKDEYKTTVNGGERVWLESVVQRKWANFTARGAYINSLAGNDIHDGPGGRYMCARYSASYKIQPASANVIVSGYQRFRVQPINN